MTSHRRLIHFAAAGAPTKRQWVFTHLADISSLRRKAGRAPTSLSLRSGHVLADLSAVGLNRVRSCSHVHGVLYSEAEAVFISEGVFLRLPPNKRLNRTAHQRCWWVPVPLRAPAAG